MKSENQNRWTNEVSFIVFNRSIDNLSELHTMVKCKGEVLRSAVKKYVCREFIIMAIHYKDFLKINQSKSAGAKGDVPKIYGFVYPLHPC